MNQPTLSLEEQPAKPKVDTSGFYLQPWQKGALLIVLL